MRLFSRSGVLLLWLLSALPAAAQCKMDEVARVKEFVTGHYHGAAVSHLFDSGSHANPESGLATAARIGTLKAVRILACEDRTKTIVRTRLSCGAAVVTLVATFDSGEYLDISVVAGAEAGGAPAQEDVDVHAGAAHVLNWLAQGAPGGVKSIDPPSAVTQEAVNAASSIAMRVCAGAKPVVVGGTTEEFVVGRSYVGNTSFERGVVSFSVDTSQRGLLTSFYFSTPLEDERDRDAADGDVSIDEKESLREKLDMAARELERDHHRLTVVHGETEDFYEVDAAEPLLKLSRNVTAEAFDAPSLAGARRIATASVNRVTASIERVTLRQTLVMAKGSVDAAIEATLNLWKRYREAEDLSPDLHVSSKPTHAKFVIQVGEDEKTRRQTETNDSLRNVWLGVYDATITRDGFKEAQTVIDLVNDTRTTVRCQLSLKRDKEPSRCRQYEQDETERDNE